eukprot:1025878-Rhodomonas_salina.3
MPPTASAAKLLELCACVLASGSHSTLANPTTATYSAAPQKTTSILSEGSPSDVYDPMRKPRPRASPPANTKEKLGAAHPV